MRLLYATDVRTSAITFPLLRAEVEPRWEGRVLVVDGTGVVIPVPDDSRLRPQGEAT